MESHTVLTVKPKPEYYLRGHHLLEPPCLQLGLNSSMTLLYHLKIIINNHLLIFNFELFCQLGFRSVPTFESSISLVTWCSIMSWTTRVTLQTKACCFSIIVKKILLKMIAGLLVETETYQLLSVNFQLLPGILLLFDIIYDVLTFF